MISKRVGDFQIVCNGSKDRMVKLNNKIESNGIDLHHLDKPIYSNRRNLPRKRQRVSKMASILFQTFRKYRRILNLNLIKLIELICKYKRQFINHM